MNRPNLAQVRPDLARKRRPRRLPRNARLVLRDVDRLAEAVAETIQRLDAAGLSEYARPLEEALVKLAGRHMPKAETQ